MNTQTSFANVQSRTALFGAFVVQPPPRPLALSSKTEALLGLEMFRDCAGSDLYRLAEAAMLRPFRRGSLLRGVASRDCVVLVRGRAQIRVPRAGSSSDFAVGIFEAGDIVSEGCWAAGAAPLFGETVALEDSEALLLPRAALETFLERNIKVTFRFLEALANKLGRLVDLATQNSCLAVGDRLYRRLVSLAAVRGSRRGDGILISHGLYQRELAASIGASREVVNKQLAEWRDAGLIELGRKFVIVRNPVGLMQAVSSEVRGEGFIQLPGFVPVEVSDS